MDFDSTDPRPLLAVLDGIDDIIYVSDPDTFELLYVNAAFRRSWGGEVLGQKCHKVLQGRDLPCSFCTNDKIFGEQLGKTHVWEFQNRLTKQWYRCADRAIRWLDGKYVRFELASDISEQRRVQDELSESKARFERVADILPDMIFGLSLPDGEYLYVSPSARAVFGVDAGDFIEKPWLIKDLLHPDWLAAYEAHWQACCVGEAPTSFEFQVIDPSGRTRWLNQRQVLLRDPQGVPNAVWGIITDVSGSQRLQRLSDELVTIMDAVPGLVFYKDRENRFIRVNRFVADAHGLSKAEIEGKSCYALYPEDQARAYHDDDLAVINSGRARLNIDEPWQTKDGPRWISTSKMPFVDANGEIVGVIGVSIDVTERRAAEQELVRRSRVTTSINRVFQEALECDTLTEVAQRALKVAEELTGSAFGFIGELNEAGRLDTIGLSNPGWEVCNVEDTQKARLLGNMKVRGLWGMIIESGRSAIINEPSAHPASVGLPSGHPPLLSFMGVPFLRDGRALGMIALANKAGGYHDEDLEAIETLSASFYEVLIRKRMELRLRDQSLLEAAQAELAKLMMGDPDERELCSRILTYVCTWLQLPLGLLYVPSEQQRLRLGAAYALELPETTIEIGEGEGLVGQALREKRELILRDVPADYYRIRSGLGSMLPSMIILRPVFYNGRVAALFELGARRELDALQCRFLEVISESVGASLDSAKARALRARMLEQAQTMTQELQAQQEELRATNEELEEQTLRLRESEARLKAQQEELQVTNEELEEKTELLERQKRDVDLARGEITRKAHELELASKYKSEFLANMSHELRTPLNSLLLLSRSLAENKDGNLNPDQVESARVIYDGGNDLLALINEILDLSKIEAGRMELRLESVLIADLAASMRTGFTKLAAAKRLEFMVETLGNVPESIFTDRQRLEQVLRNLLGNAIKFTEQGSVNLRFSSENGAEAGPRLCIEVSDTGIGIAPEHQQVIFEAFKQLDGGTARRFGGTGLGLSIARELSKLLGGQLQLRSELGQGSTFTLSLPLRHSSPREEPVLRPEPLTSSKPAAVRLQASMADDRLSLQKAERSVLIIEDDLRFAEILASQCRSSGFKVLAASTGESGLELARQFTPHGILLDIKLPGIDGWRVLELLKEDADTRHIPVHILSADAPSSRALRKGAIGYLQKPTSIEQISEAIAKLERTRERSHKRVLVVEDDAVTRRGVVELLSDNQVEVNAVAGGTEALEALRGESYDCVVLDLGLWDCDGSELIERASQDPQIELPPVIVYTARDLSWEDDLELRNFSDTVIIKGVRSDERLLDEVSLFLHRVVAEMPEKKRQVITSLHDADAGLRDKTVLLVDDDMRALFALTKLLSERGMKVLKAENGQRALDLLEREATPDIVLMDIMMPVLDGFETMKRIRAQERFKRLPIIALTAKAMRGDQERCMESGATDYLPKPVDQERLISMLRVWLYR
ncbi:MAG: response regulator [Myxococcota bacterium]|jgi:PAS domain S-box-containing protein|nr:response regulator [Myxococcota bacterium]